MAPKSRSILFVFLSILLFSISSAASSGNLVGGWRPIGSPNDPEVVKIAQFAVTEHNKEANANLEYVKVVKGETQVVAGTNYRLVIAAKNGGAGEPKNYRAVVWSKPWQKFLKLVSFEGVQA